MNSSTSPAGTRRNRARRVVSAVVVLFAVTGLSSSALSASGSALAATPATPPVALVSTTATVQIQRYKGEPVYLYNLGIYLQAQQNAVEFQVKRPKYNVPVVASLTVGEGSSAGTTPIPASAFTSKGVVDISTLPNFYTYAVNTSAGKLVKTGKRDFCPNSQRAARSVRDAPVSSPFPDECYGGHPFAIGNLFGIQRGWAVPVLSRLTGAPTFQAKDGTYTLVIKINKTWQTLFGLSDTQSQTSIKIKVKTIPGDEGEAADSAGIAAMPQTAGMSAAEAAHLSPQRAGIHAAQMQALGKPQMLDKAVPNSKITAADLPPGTPAPDLRSLPADQIRLHPVTTTVKKKKKVKTYLDFTATVWNGGTSPLVVDGFRRQGSTLMDAYQYFYDAAGNEAGSVPAGTLPWDGRTGHNDWNFPAFASYSLLDSTKTFTALSGMEAFCPAPTDAIDLTLPDATLKPYSTDLSTACGQGDESALSIREVLDAGWGDTEVQDLPGQSFNITKVPNGIYYVEVLANPHHVLTELNPDNNRSLRKIKIGGKVGGKRTLKVYAYQGITAN